ncbi:7747_t:CDS:2, partial [Racocetra fulgida]
LWNEVKIFSEEMLYEQVFVPRSFEDKEIELKNENIKIKTEKAREMCSNSSSITWKRTYIEYRPSFMEGLELDAFFPCHRIALE